MTMRRFAASGWEKKGRKKEADLRRKGEKKSHLVEKKERKKEEEEEEEEEKKFRSGDVCLRVTKKERKRIKTMSEERN